MSKISDLHTLAMRLAADAELARRAGDVARADALFTEALNFESKAAYGASAAEPTRSILFRSAASLAIECNNPQLGEQLIGAALAGDAPEEIRQELRDLYETINFQRHLILRETVLAPTDIQLALAGDAVGFGLISIDEYLPRITTVENLLIRTAERQHRIPFRERGRPQSAIKGTVPLFLSAGMAASFSTTIRVGQKLKQLRLFDESASAVRELVECFGLFAHESIGELQRRIDNRAYYRNFVQQAKQLSPDGIRIRTVGFTASIQGQTRSVAITRPPSEKWDIAKSLKTQSVTVVGEIVEAQKKIRVNRIGLKDDSNRIWTIHVPPGLMADIVRPLWERRVVVSGPRVGDIISLRDIRAAD